MIRARTLLSIAVIALAACRSSPRSAVSAAASAGDVPNLQSGIRSPAAANATDPDGMTPLACAARQGQAEAIRFLLAHGADPNLVDSLHGWTPLLHAVHRHQRAAAEQLLLGRANPNQAVAGGLTPLMMSAGYGDAEMVRLLLARGASAGLRDTHGESALDYALGGISDIDDFTIFRCQDDAARALIAGGARLEGTRADQIALASARLKGCRRI